MKIEIWSIGKNKKDDFQKPLQVYLDRIKHIHKVTFKFFKESPHKKLSPTEIKDQESKTFLDQFTNKHFYVTLDETGKHLSSVQLSKELKSIETNPSFDKLIFCIGGAYGFNDEIRKRSNLTLSLSHLTFPHKMVKLFLIEQIYRSYTIQTNHGYHKT